MKTTWENIVHHVGTIHGCSIRNGLLNNKRLLIPKLEHTQYSLDENQLSTERRDQPHQCLAELWQFQKGVFEDQVVEEEPNISAKDKMSLAILNN